jgi:hypothetical protein
MLRSGIFDKYCFCSDALIEISGSKNISHKSLYTSSPDMLRHWYFLLRIISYADDKLSGILLLYHIQDR